MTELRDLLERAAGPAPSETDVTPLVGDDLARGRRALRRRTTARAAAGVAVIGVLALAVPRVLPALDGAGDAGPAGQGPTVSVTQAAERPVAEVYAGVEAALAERGLASPGASGSTLRWSTGSGPLWLTAGTGRGTPPIGLLDGTGLSGTNHDLERGGMDGLWQVGVVLQRVSRQPEDGTDYCALIQPESNQGYDVNDESLTPAPCEQREVDGGTLFVTESDSAWNLRYVTVGLVRDDATAVSVNAALTPDFTNDVLVDLVQDPRLRW